MQAACAVYAHLIWTAWATPLLQPKRDIAYDQLSLVLAKQQGLRACEVGAKRLHLAVCNLQLSSELKVNNCILETTIVEACARQRQSGITPGRGQRNRFKANFAGTCVFLKLHQTLGL
mmetsp:Transcript_31018/g.67907  ORF Transcript_31018/g.67907 Transcript_31018/m.67907 type:complete len:118 (+) Transcript_31018:1117-1470(+)